MNFALLKFRTDSALWDSLHPCVRTPAFALNPQITKKYYWNFHAVASTKCPLKGHGHKNIRKISGSQLLGCCRNENTALLGCIYGAFSTWDTFIAKHRIPQLWQSLFYLRGRFLSCSCCQMRVHSDLMTTDPELLLPQVIYPEHQWRYRVQPIFTTTTNWFRETWSTGLIITLGMLKMDTRTDFQIRYLKVLHLPGEPHYISLLLLMESIVCEHGFASHKPSLHNYPQLRLLLSVMAGEPLSSGYWDVKRKCLLQNASQPQPVGLGHGGGIQKWLLLLFLASEIELTKNSSSTGTRLPENSCFSGAGLAASERSSY